MGQTFHNPHIELCNPTSIGDLRESTFEANVLSETLSHFEEEPGLRADEDRICLYQALSSVPSSKPLGYRGHLLRAWGGDGLPGPQGYERK